MNANKNGTFSRISHRYFRKSA